MFSEVRMFLLTNDREFFEKNEMMKFPSLAAAKGIIWGEVDSSQFKEKFGSLATPQIFLFNKSGQLINKFRGEVSVERILKKF